MQLPSSFRSRQADPRKVTCLPQIVLIFLSLCLSISTSLDAREVIPFNQQWHFKKGPFSSDPILFAASFDQRWQEVTLPHTWNAKDMQNEKNAFYEGEAYYKKTYTPATSLKDKRIFIRFEGVGATAEVYVNGVLAGNHKGAYSAFAIELSNLLKWGEANEILVKVDNASRPDVIPVNHILFGVYGGIYRPVELIVTDKVNIAVTDYAAPGCYIRQKNVTAQSANVHVTVKIENKNKEQKTVILRNTIYDAHGKLIVQKESNLAVVPQGRQTFSHDFVLKKPCLWQGLDDPYLYKVETQLLEGEKLIDAIVQPLGLRHIELKANDGMYLNGKKIPMYGVCRHQDWLGYGSALSNEQHAADLEIIREMGATTIRFAHYQQSDYLYSKCDSIGFLIWAEIPFVNRVSTQEADNAKQQLQELIRQSFNHPSIYVWGLHNEVYQPHNYTAALTSDLNDLAKTEDPDRYTVAVNGYGQVDHPVNLNADLQGMNRYYGWYERKIQNLEDWAMSLDKDYQGYKLILAEYGAEANIEQQQEIVGDVGTFHSQWYPETFATKFHEIQWGIIAKHPSIVASYLWNTFDFATPKQHQGGVPARNTKGLVTFDRQVKKDVFYWYKANWSKEPVLYLTQRRCTERENQTTSVTVYSNVGTPVLLVNGQQQNKFRQGTTAVHYIFEDIQLQEGSNVIETKVSKGATSYKDTISWNYSPTNKKTGPNNLEVKENKGVHSGL